MYILRSVNFGFDYSGLTTVGYTLINSDGSTYQSRTTSGVFEVQIDSGIYGVDINFDDPVNLIILWDDGQDEPLYASEEIYINNTDTTSILDIVTDIDNKSDIIINTTNIIDNKIDILSTDCTNLNEKIDIIDNKSDVIINTTNDINTEVNIIDNKIDILNTDCTNLSEVVGEIDNKVDTIINTTNIIDNKIDILSTDCTNLDSKIDILNTKSDVIINTTNIIDNKIDILSTDCTNLNEKIDIIDNKSDIIISTTNEINNKVDEILIDSTNMDIKLDIIDSKCTEISNDLKRVLGLVHENIFIDLPSYDDDSNLISARLRIYSNPISVGTNNNILATYIIESDSSGPGKFTNWKQVRS